MSVNSVVARIKNLKIQGATNIAVAALNAYFSAKNRADAKRKLLASRPTEPMMRKVLELASKGAPKQEILDRLRTDMEKISEIGARKLGATKAIFTHCHSTTVINIIKRSRVKVVYNTEARPLYQGRITARELAPLLKVVHSVDSNMDGLLAHSEVVLIGADAILPSGVLNKIGSAQLAKLAYLRKIPVYVCAHSWKVVNSIKVEERDPSEVWKSPRGVKVVNPAFDLVENKYISAIICEKGVLTPKRLFR